MAKPRVLVVDDSVVARRLVSSALASDGSVEVLGVAADGRVALASIERLRPDAVTLDVDMPVMDGLETLEAIRERWPDLVVIMFSTYTARGAQITLDALTLGEDEITSLGISVRRIRLIVVVAATLGTAAVVAVGGTSYPGSSRSARAHPRTARSVRRSSPNLSRRPRGRSRAST